MAERDGSLVASRTEYEDSIDRNLNLASRALGSIATLVEEANGSISDDEADIELSKVSTLKAISERALEISRIYSKIYDLDAETIKLKDLILLAQLLQEQLEDIGKYKRDDKVKECLESLGENYFELANAHCLFCKALQEDARLNLETEEEKIASQKKRPPLQKSLSFSEKAAMLTSDIQRSFKGMQQDFIPISSTLIN